MMKTYTLRQGDVVTSRILAILLHHADEPLCQAREDLFELRELGWTRQRRDPNLLMGDDRRLRRTGSPRRRWLRRDLGRPVMLRQGRRLAAVDW